jgi:hypothetical protein
MWRLVKAAIFGLLNYPVRSRTRQNVRISAAESDVMCDTKIYIAEPTNEYPFLPDNDASNESCVVASSLILKRSTLSNSPSASSSSPGPANTQTPVLVRRTRSKMVTTCGLDGT